MTRNNGFDSYDYKCNPKPEDKLPKLDTASDQLAASIFHAAGRGELAKVKELCTKHELDTDNLEGILGGPQSASQYRQHAFSAATQYPQPRVLEYLYSIGARPTAEDLTTITITRKDITMLKFFIAHGVDLNQKDHSGRSLLREAAGDDEMLDLWLSQNPDPNGGAQDLKPAPVLSTPLETVLARGRLDLAKKLIARGADPKLGQPLGAAIQHYVERHVTPNVPLMCKTAEYLIERGCDINQMWGGNIRYGPGRPLHDAARIANSEPLIELLIKHGADPVAYDAYFATPFEWAVKYGANSPKKEDLLLGAQGIGFVSDAHAFTYSKMGFRPLSGFSKDEFEDVYVKTREDKTQHREDSEDSADEGEEDDDEQAAEPQIENKGGVLTRLQSIFTGR